MYKMEASNIRNDSNDLDQRIQEHPADSETSEGKTCQKVTDIYGPYFRGIENDPEFIALYGSGNALADLKIAEALELVEDDE